MARNACFERKRGVRTGPESEEAVWEYAIGIATGKEHLKEDFILINVRTYTCNPTFS